MKKYVFIVGSPRSGTTWLQLLLSQHSGVSSCPETHLFNQLVQPLRRSWDMQARSPDGLGLPAIMSTEDFVAILRRLTLSALDRIGSTEVILEKTRVHVRVIDLILEIIPEAWFIHVVRDPRAVTSSRISAVQSWGSRWSWGSANAAANARMWVSDVSAGLALAEKTSQCKTVRYEDMLSDTVGTLQDIFGWMKLEVDTEFCHAATCACAFEKLRSGEASHPWYSRINRTDFYRKGTAQSWQLDLKPSQIATVEYIAGDVMTSLGYKRMMASRKPFTLAFGDLQAGALRKMLTLAGLFRRCVRHVDTSGLL